MSKSATVGEAEYVTAHEVINTIKEAAAYFNIGIKKMRRMAEENTGRYSVFCGNKHLIIRPKFEKFIDESSEI